MTDDDRTFDWDRALTLFKQGKTCKEIGEILNVNWHSVGTAIGKMRKRYGEDVVPYWSDIQKAKKPKPKPPVGEMSRLYKERRASKDAIMTWAGAFRVLALYLHDSGDEEGWALAQQIAREKGMSL
jgi:hypothetical protein